MPVKDKTVCVVGLGYVGLPLSEAFSHHVKTYGFDISEERMKSLQKDDREFIITSDPTVIRNADYVIICVPTPITITKQPDLSYIESAARIVGHRLKPGAIVVLESTVYPGVTEDIVAPILEEESCRKCGKDFYIGYSPERINPGDELHTLATTTKIVAGMNEEITDKLVELYSLITTVYRAKNIRIAEAAKVIENIQRDLNIALMNELTIIFHHMDIDIKDVLETAGSKWNFLKFSPGLVGGHCISVDPYYLVSKAYEFNYYPKVILAGRSINDSMPQYVAMQAIEAINFMGKVIKGSKVLVMGLTYKEDVPDIRESPGLEIIRELKKFGIEVYGYDPVLSDEVVNNFGVKNYTSQKGVIYDIKFDAIIIAVAHHQFKKMKLDWFTDNMADNPILVDVRRMIDKDEAEKNGIYYRGL